MGLALAALVMAFLKGYCAWVTLGTNDVRTFASFAGRLHEVGLVALYHETMLFNHTPLTAWYLELIRGWSLANVHWFPFWLRLPGIMADLALAFLLISQRRQPWASGCPTWALTLLILSPVSFMVSGYHGNFDSVMVFLLVVAVVLAVKERPLPSGALFAVSLQVKVAPLIVLPVVLIYFGRRSGSLSRFFAGAALVCLAGYGLPLAEDPLIFIRNVFGYNGYWGVWGVSYWLRMTGWEPLGAVAMAGHGALKLAIIQSLKAGILLGGAALAWRQRPFTVARLFPTLGLAWGVFFVFSPAIAPQYLVWLAPFVLFCNARWFAVLTVGSTLGAFFFYQRISGGLPWYYGQAEVASIPLWTPWMLWAWAACAYGLLPFSKVYQPQEAPLLT